MSSQITFSEFMRAALYDEDRGYYMIERERFGRTGDFYTASQVHELFGALFADEFARIWRSLAEPSDFTIVELGPGRGEFARDALTALRDHHPECFARLHYLSCEISPVLCQEQRKRLQEFSKQVGWITSLSELSSPITGIFFSNEFFDALPVHLIRESSGQLRELYVARMPDSSYEWIEDELSSREIEEYWRRVGNQLVEGQCAEMGLEAALWIKDIARHLVRGRVITIDYGDIASRLYTPDRAMGTLRCFHRHTLNDEPLKRIGEQDITASVNFTALIEYGRYNGLEPVTFTRQIDYLVGLGLLERVADLAAQTAENENLHSLARRLALKQFFLPQGLAAHFKVLVQDKQDV